MQINWGFHRNINTSARFKKQVGSIYEPRGVERFMQGRGREVGKNPEGEYLETH